MKCKLIAALGSFVYSCFVSMAVLADDIEIYLGAGNQQTTYRPNVMFIMDTSGSMTNQDGTGESRMIRVKNALKDVLNSATNINVGLMRFHDYGGPVLYPITNIDQVAEPEIITSITSSANDAHEYSGTVYTSNSTLKLAESTDSYWAGFRFEDLQIPQGATITKAYLNFYSDGFNVAGTDLIIYADSVGNSQAFSSSDSITGRTTTTSSVAWNTDNDWPLSGEVMPSPDISAVLQEVVNHPDWCGGNAASILIEGIGSSIDATRYVRSFDYDSDFATQLVVEYDHTTVNGCVAGSLTYQIDNQNNNTEEQTNGYESTGSELTFNPSNNDYVGVRFNNVAIPQGATITNAYLTLTAYGHHTGSGASMKIAAAAADDVDDFSSHDRYLLQNMAKTTSTSWSGIPKWYKNSDYQSPSIAAQVQEVVNRAGWLPGNALAIIMHDFSGDRGAYTYNGKPSGAPQLTIEYQGNATADTAAKVRDRIISQIDTLQASGYTPIVDTLYEAALYYGGLDVDYGLTRGNSSVSNTVRKSTRVSTRDSYIGSDSVKPSGCTEDNLSDSDCINEYIPSGATYISPVTNLQCQTNNHIVLLSDGEANNNHSVDEIETLLGSGCDNDSSGEKCGIDLVANLEDIDDSAIGPRIITHTIGFAANANANSYLNQLALNGGGAFYEANDSTALVEAFQTIIRSVKDANATFVSPGVAVNQLNRLTHRNELYFALFKPKEGYFWPGNLKKYKLSGDAIIDVNGQNAVDEGTGFFKDSGDAKAHSYWSAFADGNAVDEGGAASRISLPRNTYFFTGEGNILSSANEIHEDNSDITTIDLAIADLADPEAVRTDLLKWARGVDVLDNDVDGDTTDARLQMGDPLHSQPVIINYSASESAVFVATNHGFLHAIDPDDGEILFSVMPKELLTNMYSFYRDQSTINHLYGLDGDIVVHTEGNQYNLIVGMRRGGNNYYSFNVTNTSSPSVNWQIIGGSTGFEKLGQTWSRPTITSIDVGGSETEVLIFGGGYDDAQDGYSERSTDSIGNAVYIVNASTGELIWSASDADSELNLTDMVYSIPARVSVVDRNSDGLADHMYVVDMGGQIFRLDIQNGEGAASLVRGGKIAQLSADNSSSDARRFYYGVDVAEVNLGDEHFFAIATGSGFRAHPLNTQISDRFYMIKDTGVFTFDEDGYYTYPDTPYTESDLYNATNHLLTSSDSEAQELAVEEFTQKNGWYINLATGEKVLASPVIINYRILFTTYTPAAASDNECAPPTGNSSAYVVELINGNAIVDLNQNSMLDADDRKVDLNQPGIAPEAKILITDPTHPVVCLGTECGSTSVEIKSDGTKEACENSLDCLTENVFGVMERVRKGSWTTSTERVP